MGHHCHSDKHHKKHKSDLQKPTFKTDSKTSSKNAGAKAIVIEGVLLDESFTNTPYTTNLSGGSNTLYTTTILKPFVLDMNCGYTINFQTAGQNTATVQVIKTSGQTGGVQNSTTLAVSSVSSPGALTSVPINVFWNGPVAAGETISIVASSQFNGTIVIAPNTFKLSMKSFSTPEF